MGTTALFAELVVGGVLTLTWMLLLAMTALGPFRFTPLPEISPTLTAGLLFAVAYALGVIFDRVWDFLLDVTGLQIWFRGGSQVAMPMSEPDRKSGAVFLGQTPRRQWSSSTIIGAECAWLVQACSTSP